MRMWQGWLPFLCVLAQVAIFGAACVVADYSGITTPPGEWPYLLGFVLMTVFWASWPLGITLVTGAVAALSREPANRRGATVVGSAVAAAAGGLGVLLGAVWSARADYASEWLVAGSLVLGGATTLVGVRAALRRPLPPV